MGEERKLYKVFVGKPEGKSSLGRPSHRWEDGIRIDVRETSWEDVECVQLSQDSGQWWAVVNAVMNTWVQAPQS
jgi:hypothetical protein